MYYKQVRARLEKYPHATKLDFSKANLSDEDIKKGYCPDIRIRNEQSPNDPLCISRNCRWKDWRH
jgi:hypothetical protein